MSLTTAARVGDGAIGLIYIDRTSCGSYNGTSRVGLGIDQPRLDIPTNEMSGDVAVREVDGNRYLARVKKASSTPSLTCADVSMN